jgi:hypothetical protein
MFVSGRSSRGRATVGFTGFVLRFLATLEGAGFDLDLEGGGGQGWDGRG